MSRIWITAVISSFLALAGLILCTEYIILWIGIALTIYFVVNSFLGISGISVVYSLFIGKGKIGKGQPSEENYPDT
ncbi:MAG: hypothetical protein P1Q69_10915 [Candidatus Thorarchaeota archaeon]|nr:hypothetical protein [Candidatus Thorarchaeota archaeon]